MQLPRGGPDVAGARLDALVVVVDPEMSGGAATVRGIRTEALAELAADGLSVAARADDYGLPEDELRQALAYEWDTSHLQAA